MRTAEGPLYTVRCEAIFNNHPQIYRSALVGLGEPSQQRPVIIAEPEASAFPTTPAAAAKLRAELLELGRAHELTRSISEILFHRSLPVDIRHNVKIFREKLRPWATARLRRSSLT